MLDVDGDGHLDAVTGGERRGDGGLLCVFRGDGTGGLASPSVVHLSGIAGRLEAVDMDLDGYLDLVAEVGSGLCVLMRQPAGGLAPEVNYDAPVYGMLAVGDVNSDAYPDVVTAGSYGDAWQLLNAGDGALLDPVKISGTSSTTALVLGDVDGDGHSDLARRVFVAGSGYSLSLHLGDGHGQFSSLLQERTEFAEPLGTVRLANGREVLLVRGGLLATLSLEGGHLTPPRPFLHSSQSYEFALADFDEDGHTDWIAGLWQEDKRAGIAVYRGAGDGTLHGVRVSSTPINSGVGALVDLNADGTQDVLGGDQQHTVIFVQLGLPGGTFQPAAMHRIDCYQARFLPADYDGDGFLDVAVYSQYPPSFGLLRGDGAGGLAPVQTLYTPAPITPSGGLPIASDVDGDGCDEVIVSVTHEGAMLVLGAVDGRFVVDAMLDAPSVIAPLFARNVAGALAADILYLRRGPNEICEVWCLSLGAKGSWQPAFPFMLLPLPWLPGRGGLYDFAWSETLHLCDVDEDDRLDVVAWRSISQPFIGLPGSVTAGSQLGIWRGLPGGEWESTEAARLAGDAISSVGPLDVDGDGDLELVLNQYCSSNFVYGGCLVLQEQSGGQFVGDPERYSAFATPNVDVNGDGYLDAVHAANSGIVTYLNLTVRSQ